LNLWYILLIFNNVFGEFENAGRKLLSVSTQGFWKSSWISCLEELIENPTDFGFKGFDFAFDCEGSTSCTAGGREC